MSKTSMTEDRWKSVLDPEVYHVTREQGTEKPYSGKYDNFFRTGSYHCICCGSLLFDSTHKFNSGCGWPAFSDVVSSGALKTIRDRSFGMERVEVRCAECDAHLGHVFEDGPAPTGLRYCINSVAMEFREEEGD